MLGLVIATLLGWGRADRPALLGSLAVALAAAWVVAFPVNRRLMACGQGHAVVHRHMRHH